MYNSESAAMLVNHMSELTAFQYTVANLAAAGYSHKYIAETARTTVGTIVSTVRRIAYKYNIPLVKINRALSPQQIKVYDDLLITGSQKETCLRLKMPANKVQAACDEIRLKLGSDVLPNENLIRKEKRKTALAMAEGGAAIKQIINKIDMSETYIRGLGIKSPNKIQPPPVSDAGLALLTERERQIAIGVWKENKPGWLLAKELNISKQRVSKIKQSAIRKLKMFG